MAKRNPFTREYYTGMKDQYDLYYAIFQKVLWTADYGRMKAATVRQHIKEAGTAAKVLQMHAHALRKYCAPNLIRAGVDLRKVQIHLGHANIQHADLYAPA